MRSVVVLSALAGLVAGSPFASPSPQDINVAEFKAAPVPEVQGPAVGATQEIPTYNPSDAAASAYADVLADPVATTLVKRQATFDSSGCGNLQPDGYGPLTSPDTAENFVIDSQYPAIANAASVPQGYTQSFRNVQGSIEGNGYLGLYTMQTFDTTLCQQYCDAASACYGINVFMERNPKYDPTYTTCRNPPSITKYKCTLWGYAITAATATNQGQWYADFHVVIAGSNGYTKLAAPPAQKDFTGPTEVGGAINAPSAYIGMKYQAGPYDPSICAAACKATNDDGKKNADSTGSYAACNFFNAYVLSADNQPQGTYCSLYSTTLDKSYGTIYTQTSGGTTYSVSQSYGYTLTTKDNGKVDKPSSASSSSSSLTSSVTSASTTDDAKKTKDATTTLSSTSVAPTSSSMTSSAVPTSSAISSSITDDAKKTKDATTTSSSSTSVAPTTSSVSSSSVSTRAITTSASATSSSASATSSTADAKKTKGS